MRVSFVNQSKNFEMDIFVVEADFFSIIRTFWARRNTYARTEKMSDNYWNPQ